MSLLIILAILGCIPGAIASSKGRPFLGWWLYGALLFIVALIHSLCLSKNHQAIEREKLSEGLAKCPYCAEMIKPEAIKCRHCGSEIEPSKLLVEDKKNATPDGTSIRFDRLLIIFGVIVAIAIVAHMSGS